MNELSDEEIMELVLSLAQQGIGQVEPNPYVGCVITQKNKIIGQGFHKKFGQNHAEVNAIESVLNIEPNFDFSNCSLYVNLEPCSHFGKTPPCADLIIKHKFKSVIVALKDPNPLVAGQGIEKLIKAGIQVRLGILEEKAILLNQKFISYIRTQDISK